MKASMSMLVRYTLAYLPSRLLPALVNFLSVFVFTRALSPTEYGYYSIALAVVMATQLIFFQWLRLGVQRYYQGARRDNQLSTFLCTVGAAYVTVGFGVILAWTIVLLFIPLESVLKSVLWIALPLSLIRALFEVNLELQRAAFAPKAYGLLAVSRALLGFGLAWLLSVYLQLGERGLVLGITFGEAVPLLFLIPAWVRSTRVWRIEWTLLSSMLQYGIPLTLTSIFGFVTALSDRFFLQHYLGAESVGLYSVAYDLTQQSLIVILTIVHLAAYPMAVKAFEEGGVEKAKEQLRQNALLLFGVALPASTGFALLAPDIVSLMLGEDFRNTAKIIMPWIAFSTLLLGLKEFYFDIAFHLTKQTKLQLLANGVAAICNIILNIILIPKIGIIGAVYATVVAYAIGIAMSIWLGRRVLRVPVVWDDLGRLLVATMAMAVAVFWVPKREGWGDLILQVAIGSSVYVLVFVILFRSRLYNSLRMKQ